MSGARQQALDRWEEFIAGWLDDDAALRPPFDAWWSSYRGKCEGQPTRDALPELYIGDWEAPRLVTLAINPGRPDFAFQGRAGYFAEQIRRTSYQAWARTDPYGSPLWEAQNGVNRPRRSGRRVNPHREERLRFAARWLGDPRVRGSELLMLELYPWHSRSAKGLIRPPAAALDEFIWAPLAELDVRTVFAFGADWGRMATALHLPRVAQWPLGSFYSSVRQGAVFAIPNGRQRLAVLWQSGYAGPPAKADGDRLHELLGE